MWLPLLVLKRDVNNDEVAMAAKPDIPNPPPYFPVELRHRGDVAPVRRDPGLVANSFESV